MDNFVQNYFVHLGIMCMGGIVFYAYLHYELLYNNRDLIFWRDSLRQCLSEIGRYKYAYSFITFIAVMNLVLICAALTRKSNSINWLEEEEHEEELKERYRDFLFIRLLSTVDKIEERYMRGSEQTAEQISFGNLVRAHNEIWSAISNFRKDAHKLYKLNETEIWLPLEDVYSLLEDEENEIVRTSYHKAKVTIDYERLAALLYE